MHFCVCVVCVCVCVCVCGVNHQFVALISFINTVSDNKMVLDLKDYPRLPVMVTSMLKFHPGHKQLSMYLERFKRNVKKTTQDYQLWLPVCWIKRFTQGTNNYPSTKEPSLGNFLMIDGHFNCITSRVKVHRLIEKKEDEQFCILTFPGKPL